MKKLAQIAWRNLSRNRRRSVITMLALLAGISLVLMMEGFVNGFEALSVREVVEGSTGALQVHRKGYLDNLDGAPLQLSMPYSAEMLAKIRSVAGVRAVTGRILFDGLINNGISQTMFSGRGLDLETEYLTTPQSGAHVGPGGRQLHAGDMRVALVGEELANSFNAVTTEERQHGAPALHGVAPTDLLTLNCTSPQGRVNSLGVKVVGKIRSTNVFENKRVVTVSLPLAQSLLNMPGRVTEYAVAVDDLNHLDRIVQELRHTLGPDYDVQPWPQLQPFTRDALQRMSIVLGVVTTVFMVIVLTGIINTMLMSVFERVREIGTMLALGTRKSQIRMLFLFEAAILAAVGATLGCLLALAAVSWLGARGVQLPQANDLVRPFLSVKHMIIAVAFAVLATLMAALYPAWKASQLNPVDALRSL